MNPVLNALRPRVTGLLLAAALIAPPVARADERFDHRGAVGLLVGGGAEYLSGIASERLVQGLRGDLELGGTLAVGVDGNELLLIGRATLGDPAIDWSVIFGYRGYFGQEGRFSCPRLKNC
jgi:hypothetical protein